MPGATLPTALVIWTSGLLLDCVGLNIASTSSGFDASTASSRAVSTLSLPSLPVRTPRSASVVTAPVETSFVELSWPSWRIIDRMPASPRNGPAVPPFRPDAVAVSSVVFSSL